MGVGVYEDYDIVRQWVKLGPKSVPSPETHAHYLRLYAIFRDLYPDLKDQFIRLSEAIA